MAREKDALATWIGNSLEGYPAVAAVTLNFKQGRQYPHGWVHLDRAIATTQISWFLKNLDRAIFRNGFKRANQRTIRAVVHEPGSLGDHHHVHLAIGIPPGILPVKFLDLAEGIWSRANWGYGRGDMDLAECRDKWISYILKFGPESFDDTNSELLPQP